MHLDTVIIGAGAAGLLAAVRAAECGRHVVVLEKNRKPGVKILISGGTRCNLTHATDRRGIAEAFGSQGKFLRSALAALGPRELIQLVETEGVPTKVEDSGKVFPTSDRAADVLQALLRRLQESGARLVLEEALQSLDREGNGFRLTTSRQSLTAERVIVTSGGRSYPKSGTTGDGYRWAERLGHTVLPTRPALTPLTTAAAWVRELSGITLPDVGLRVVRSNELSDEAVRAGAVPVGHSKISALDDRRGSFLFTHFGLSGPAPMDISRCITGCSEPASLSLVCDFVPQWNREQMLEAIQEACQSGKRHLGNLVAAWVPGRLAESLVMRLGRSPDHRAGELSKVDRQRLAALLKTTLIPVTGTLGFDKAEVTAGGVCLDEVDSRTMQSKLVPNLFFAGEVLDLDGPIGGFNFQAAFSTGWLAGQSAGER